MKKFILLNFSILIFNFISHAQVFIIGGKGLLNYTMLMQDNPVIYGNKLDKVFTLGTQGGIDFRFYFNKGTYYSSTNISLAVEALYGSFGQKYQANYSDSATDYSIASKISMSSLEVPVMVHIRGQAGLYAEAGVSFGMINGVKTDYSRSPTDAMHPDFSNVTVDSLFAKNNLSGIFGFGIDSELNDHLNLTIGFRLTYGFTDLTEPQKINSADYK